MVGFATHILPKWLAIPSQYGMKSVQYQRMIVILHRSVLTPLWAAINLARLMNAKTRRSARFPAQMIPPLL
jgi:hypothetical protein